MKKILLGFVILGMNAFAELQVDLKSLDFGQVQAGAVSSYQIKVTNVGTHKSFVEAYFKKLDTQMSLIDQCPHFLWPNESCEISAQFVALDAQPTQGFFFIDSFRRGERPIKIKYKANQ